MPLLGVWGIIREVNIEKNGGDLKVVTNEKGGGSGSWLVFEDSFGPWRSMSV